jgi:hypothetical protein
MQSNRSRLFPAATIIIFALLSSCRLPSQSPNPYPTVGAIPVPAGFHRVPAGTAAFATWLRNIRLKKDRTVYLYNNRPKGNQEAQFAVLDVSVGKQDLQQCADAVMRLRAEYLYAAGDYDDINYYTEQGVRLNFQEWMHGQRTHLSGDRLVSYRGPTVVHPSGAPQRTAFDEYLNSVFMYCGTRSLEKQMLPVPSFKTIQAGDVLIKGGAPGHAMLVIDVAEDAQGHRLYLLAQSYMPAQDIHIVINPAGPADSPWYRNDATGAGVPAQRIETPEWTFTINQLRRWPTPIKNIDHSN